MTRKRKCHSKSNSFVAAAEQVCLQPVHGSIKCANNIIDQRFTPIKIVLTIRYDTRCYFNVRSKADISQLNLPHGTDN